MNKTALAKYWYYRLKDNYSKENFEKRPKFDWQKNELEIFLIDNLFDIHNELEIKDKVLLRLRASSYYGKDFADYIKDLKTGVFKLIWDKEPDGLTWDEYFVKNPTDDKEIDYAAHKRTHPYDSNYFYSIVESVGSEIKEDKIDEITFNNERRSIHLVENKNLEVVDRKISAEVFAKTYTFYYESKGTGTIRTDHDQEILDDLELLLKKIEPSLKKEFEKFLLSIGINDEENISLKSISNQNEDFHQVIKIQNNQTEVVKEENKIEFKGDTWDIMFRGVNQTVRDSLGMRTIAYLIKYQGDSIKADKLYRVMTTNIYETRDLIDYENLTVDKSNIIPDEFDTVDKKTIIATKKLLREFKNDIENAIQNNADTTEIEAIHSKIKITKSYLNKVSDKYGNPRKIDDYTERARKAIGKNVKTAQNRIKDRHPIFYKHLKECLVAQKYSSYKPNPPIGWTIKLSISTQS